MKKLILVLTGVIILASCASFRIYRDKRNIETISGLINSGKSEKLAALSELPFLLDQEIIVLEKDVKSFWTEIVKAGFTIDEPELERGVDLNQESYREFYESMEVRTFFKKYLNKRTRLLELKTVKGQRILLLVENRVFSSKNRRIHGFKGPF